MGDEQTWEPISESDLVSLIAEAEARMEPSLLAHWRRVRVRPVKWPLTPWGDLGGGFWVVAVIGRECVWYNDIEDGFNASRYDVAGRIMDYWCNQGSLDDCLRDTVEGTGGGGFGPPSSIEPGDSGM